ncbi:Outer membrane receptor protein, mostly Fe transport [Methylacidiphilum infernorum V4]|uniref:Outer membrane receptor protein, mostly Fe transport n=2 Tax=Candidatus Methylacidiphilum infernorum TaxID=511746 RepID=B3DVN5_METI4|nr:Outer membrane receptor protein, mostly Fe transport [Methylacidiphilum infernorum V4]
MNLLWVFILLKISPQKGLLILKLLTKPPMSALLPQLTPCSATVAALYNLPVSQIISLPHGIYPFIGFPKEYGNLMLTYKTDSGFGASLWAIAQGGQFLSYDYSVRAPAWYTLNASFFYAAKHWEARIWFYNFTDNHYWIAGAPGFTPACTANLEYAALQMPFWMQAMIRYSF